jgi:hypothetical protein
MSVVGHLGGSVKRTSVLTVAVSVLLGVMTPEATAVTDAPVRAEGSGPATARDFKELLRQLKELTVSLKRLQSLSSGGKAKAREGEGWQPECRGYSPEKTVRCAVVKFEPEGGQEKAVSVWQCESNFGTEPPHTDAYHGPFQYLYSTYEGQRESMPDVVEWYELSAAVHDMRSNILTAVAWAARHSWDAWSCG